MIPTRSKSKISKTLAYPLGSELLSELLDGVPQYQELEISYVDHYCQSAAETVSKVRDGKFLNFLVVSYHNITPTHYAKKNHGL